MPDRKPLAGEPPPLCLTVNGEARTAAPGQSVADLLVIMGLGEATVAVERNGAIVRRAERAQVALQDGDVLEIVGFVGGG